MHDVVTMGTFSQASKRPDIAKAIRSADLSVGKR
jgi:hypothetical protein